MEEQQRQAIEAQLHRRINGLVDKALSEAKKEKPLSLGDIEEIVLAIRAKIGQEIAQALVDEQATVSVPGPSCPQCGREMHYKGRKKRRIISRGGEVDWERPYYYCETCRRGVFPPG